MFSAFILLTHAFATASSTGTSTEKAKNRFYEFDEKHHHFETNPPTMGPFIEAIKKFALWKKNEKVMRYDLAISEALTGKYENLDKEKHLKEIAGKVLFNPHPETQKAISKVEKMLKPDHIPLRWELSDVVRVLIQAQAALDTINQTMNSPDMMVDLQSPIKDFIHDIKVLLGCLVVEVIFHPDFRPRTGLPNDEKILQVFLEKIRDTWTFDHAATIGMDLGKSALHAYTTNEFYKEMNNALLTSSRKDMEKWRMVAAVTLLGIGYHHYAPSPNQFKHNSSKILYRGEKGVSLERLETYRQMSKNKKKKHVWWNKFTSTTTNLVQALDFAKLKAGEENNTRVMFIIEIDDQVAACKVQSMSEYPEEEEVLIAAYTKFVVVGFDKYDEGLRMPVVRLRGVGNFFENFCPEYIQNMIEHKETQDGTRKRRKIQ